MPSVLNLPLSIEWCTVDATKTTGLTWWRANDATVRLEEFGLPPNHAQIVDASGCLLLYADSADEYGFGQDEIDRLILIVETLNSSLSKGEK